MDKHFTQALKVLKTPKDIIRWAVSQFHEADLYFGHGTDNAWDEARYLVTYALNLPWSVADEWLDTQLTAIERKQVLKLIKKRIKKRLPAPYITGEAWFCGLPFFVDQRVLIPRSPVGELIDKDFYPWRHGQVNRVLDLCCGSGCIGIAAAYQYPDAEVVLSDLSDDALAVAETNLDVHALWERAELIKSDLFNEVAGRFDLILTNPPYVDQEDMDALPKEYRHEPRMALAAGDDGLDLVRNILKKAADYMNEDALLIVEVGNSWVHMEEAFPMVPFTWVEFERGGHGVFVMTRAELLQYQDAF